MREAYAAFSDCGWAAWLIVFIAQASVPLGLVAVLRRHKTPLVIWISVAVSLLALAAGVLGTWNGYARVDAVVIHDGMRSVDGTLPTLAEVREEGHREARQCLKVGGVFGGAPLMLSLAALALFWLRTKGPRSTDAG